MLRLHSLQLTNFRNYATLTFQPGQHINLLIGKNGSGKTNLLEAIHFLALTKGAVSSTDADYIKETEIQAVVRGLFQFNNQEIEIVSAMQAGQKKIFRVNQQDYPKLSQHIGRIPLVIILPDDVDLVREGSELRRKFFDSFISQQDTTYLENLIRYGNILKQRNSFLKNMSETGKADRVLADTYDAMLAPLGYQLYIKRKTFVQQFESYFVASYQNLVQHEKVELHYTTNVTTETEYLNQLKVNFNKDLQLQRTFFGIHRDDYHFKLGNGDLKKLGSQGQKKSFVLALKLAQANWLQNAKGYYPLLLLDDVFDKLDNHRIEKLLQNLPTNAQIFISDARPDRTLSLFQQLKLSAQVFHVEGGNLQPHE
jgi:DNA replication and repair protein RecF